MKHHMIIGLLLVSTAIHAGSLPFSHSGVLDCPDAYVLKHTEVEIELSASIYSVEDTSGASNSEFMITGHLDIGLFKYGQIGVSFLGEGGVVPSEEDLFEEFMFELMMENFSLFKCLEWAVGWGRGTGEELSSALQHDEGWSYEEAIALVEKLNSIKS